MAIDRLIEIVMGQLEPSFLKLDTLAMTTSELTLSDNVQLILGITSSTVNWLKRVLGDYRT
ncbi:hypothetical protein [Pseudomonas sp. DSP3-2-2]|uniref:hypothetical protein n=1 Tax=unclassified Pseudomonas TaxID=196821 RepID=UPI003CF547E2